MWKISSGVVRIKFGFIDKLELMNIGVVVDFLCVRDIFDGIIKVGLCEL